VSEDPAGSGRGRGMEDERASRVEQQLEVVRGEQGSVQVLEHGATGNDAIRLAIVGLPNVVSAEL